LCDGAEQRRIGIDDWVITRGHRHGTIIVDLERRQPIDVLIGRESTIVVDWLEVTPQSELSRETVREPTRTPFRLSIPKFNRSPIAGILSVRVQDPHTQQIKTRRNRH
jgi:hypothetical protein